LPREVAEHGCSQATFYILLLFPNGLAWAHYILMNVGVAGSMLLMIWGGYIAGYDLASVSSGGLGYTDLQVHTTDLGPLVNPIGALVLLAALGAVLGGLGFVIRSRMK
jgi:hypothetical protein